MNPLKLAVLAVCLTCIAQSCVGPAYVESTPSEYSQGPPPQQSNYSDQGYSQSQDAPPPVSYQSFYTELSPYGQWINTPDYGYVWIPAAGPDFQPYASSGHWVFTNYGWTWASDYSWGWAPFHYGTWDFDGTMGWFWIPGYQWSPAWVSWRSEPGYYGWAPLGPNYTNGGYASYSCPPERYVFVSATYINSPVISTYYVPRAQNVVYFGRSSVVTNTYYDRGSKNTYYAGPQSMEVEGYTGSPLRPMALVQAPSPDRANISGSQISMFRPAVQQPVNNGATRLAPQTIYQRGNISPLGQRQVLTHPNQPRATPFQQENNQRQAPANQQYRAPAPSQQPQQRPAQPQSPANQQYRAPAPLPQPQQKPAQPQPPVNQQYHAPAQPQYHAPVQQAPVNQQQHQPTQQSGAQQQRPKQKPVKPQKPQKPQQMQQQGRQ